MPANGTIEVRDLATGEELEIKRTDYHPGKYMRLDIEVPEEPTEDVAAELQSMSRSELEDLAEDLGLDVTGSGADGRPLIDELRDAIAQEME